MVDTKLRYVDKRVKPSGLVLWYFRHPMVERTRIKGQPGEPAFYREYSRLLSLVTKEEVAAKQLSDERSVRWLVERYRASKWWEQLKPKTRSDYSRELDRLCDMAGDLPYAMLTPQGVMDLRDRVMENVVAARLVGIAKREEQDAALAAKRDARDAKRAAKGLPPLPRPEPKRSAPAEIKGARTADSFKATLSAMTTWAFEARLMKTQPAFGIRKLNRKRDVIERLGWTEHQIEFALAHAPRPIRDGVVLGLYTGQRLGDCCRLSKRQCVGPIVRLRQSKTGTPLDIRATGPLVDLIARRRGANAADDAKELLLRDDGQPYTERLFSEHLRAWLDEQGWTDVSFHGLRYAAAATLNDAGATVATITSILGHRTYQMALKYLAQREEQKRAAALMEEAAQRREAQA